MIRLIYVAFGLVFLAVSSAGTTGTKGHEAPSPDFPVGPVAGECSSFKGEGGIFYRTDPIKPVGDAEFTDGMGKKRTLADFKGRPLLVNFWTTFCTPCIVEMPSMDRLQGMFDKQAFLVMPMNRDVGAMKVAHFYQRHGIEHMKIFTDRVGRLAHRNRIGPLPVTLLVDREGREVGRALGMMEWDSPEILAHLDACIGIGAPGKG